VLGQLSGRLWHRTNDLDQGYPPTTLEFSADWTYTSDYRFGQCQNSGSWNVQGREVVALADRNPCDARDSSHQETFRATLAPSGAELTIAGDRYRADPDPTQGAWTIQSYRDAVDVEVRYPLPLVQGRPQAFVFVFTNTSDEDRTLERVALNRVYSDYRTRTRGMEVPELAALDLGGRVLAPRASASAVLPVTFDGEGPLTVYFDALISGSRQAWDPRQARTLLVHPR
jgi:hypothetical protein